MGVQVGVVLGHHRRQGPGQIGVGAGGGVELEDRLQARLKEQLPQQANGGMDAVLVTGDGREGPAVVTDQAGKEVLGGGRQQIGLGAEVLEQRALAHPGAGADLGGGGAAVANLHKGLDGGLEQAMAGGPRAGLLGLPAPLGGGAAGRCDRHGRRF